MHSHNYEEQVVNKVIQVLAERLVLSKDEITIDSCLIEDLGADSLDFLDIIFSLEKKFKIQIRDSDLNKVLKTEFKPEALTSEGFLLREDLEKLRDFIPKLRDNPEPDKITPRGLFKIITVETMVILVSRKLAAKSPEN